MSRPLSAMSAKSNEWRTRSISPNGDHKMKRAVSPIPDSLSDAGSTRKYTRRPLSTSSTGAGQTVAALQQQHKWLMQQQDNANMGKLRSASPGYRSVSPAPNFSKSKSTENIKQKQQSAQISPNTNEDEVIFDDDVIDGEEEGDDVEEERMVIIQDTRARSPSINRGSGGSIMSIQPAPTFYHIPHSSPQEFKVVKEGWLFRKNVMQQWKTVYAVAKHGNAVKPGGLYLYKDAKCTSHIHTYDMSEVLEISPRAKDFKQGIKWEILMRVKRENVILGTEDPQARKDWIDSLTSIMGKVSIATQNELTSRIQSSEQMNRDLQEIAEELDTENAQLKEQIQTLKDTIAKKERYYQQDLQNRDNDLKDAINKKERALKQEFQEREEELNTEMDRQRQALEQKCEIFEREAMQWRSKYAESEKRSSMFESYSENEDKHIAKIESLELEVRKWRNRVDDLEHQQKQMEYRNMPSSNYKSRNMGSGSFESNDGVKELMTDVKFNLQLLKDHIKTPSEEPLSSIKTSIDKLYETLESAKLGWTELQGDIIKFLEGEKENSESNDVKQKTMIETLRSEFSELRDELFGVTSDDEDKKEDKLPSLSEKFDILLQMVENVQISQSRLSTSLLENNSATDSSDDSLPTTPVLTAADKDSELYKAIMSQQEQLSEWIKESRENYTATLSTIESNLRGGRSLPPVPADKVTKIVENAMDEISQKQQRSQEEQAKHIKVIGNLLKLISDDIQASSIPDLAALSQQLEDVVERLNSTEERLSMLHNSPSNWSQDTTTSLRNMPATPINLNDGDKSSQLFGFIQNTEKLMDRTLQVLNRHDGMEESIRRAVKGVSKDQLEEILNIQQQNKEERASIEKKMQRYEENARIYFEKSIDKVHSDLHEFSGVMYEMLKELVLQALEHSPITESDGQPRSKMPIEGVIELHAKLSGLNMALETEIAKLQEEKDTLENSVKKLQKTNKDLEREVDKRYEELRFVQDEYERVHKDVQRARQESTINLARELEPLINQITRLKKMVSNNDSVSENSYGEDYTDLDRSIRSKNSNQVRSKSPMPTRTRRYNEEESDASHQDSMANKLRFPNLLNNRNRRNSFNSQFSDNSEQSYDNSDKQHSYQVDQQPMKSPLIGSRDRPRLKSPHSSFLGRK